MAPLTLIEKTRTYPLSGDSAWELLTHVDRLQRADFPLALGLVPDKDDPKELSYPVQGLGALGRWLGWREYPYDWVVGRGFHVLHKCRKGPIESFVRGVRLLPGETGVDVQAYAQWTLRWRWAAPFVRAWAARWLRRVHRYAATAVALNARGGTFRFPVRKRDAIRLKGWERRLKDFRSTRPESGSLLESLKRHLTHGLDEEVFGMRPRRLATAWGADPEETVRLFLHAASEGLLMPEWTLLCAKCRWPVGRWEHLAQVPQQGECPRCLSGFRSDLDRTVELRFTVHPSVRRLRAVPWFVPGPAGETHLAFQRFIPPGEAMQLATAWGTDERFLCASARSHHVCWLSPTQRSAPRPTSVRLTYTPMGWNAEGVLFRPGEQELMVVNASQEPLVIALERLGGDAAAFMAREALSHPDFRALFPHETPAPGIRLATQGLAFFAVAVRGATDIIARSGDDGALNAFHRYLSTAAESVLARGGSVVRIFGDVLLATFPSAAQAVEAAFVVLNSPEATGRNGGEGVELPLVVAVHEGPATALSRGGALDYFGETVHRLFQLLREGGGSDLVVSGRVFDSAEVQRALVSHLFDHDSREIFRNGPSGGFRLCRIVPSRTEWVRVNSARKAT